MTRWTSLALLLFVTACGGGDSDPDPGQGGRPLSLHSGAVDFSTVAVGATAKAQVVIRNSIAGLDTSITAITASSPALSFDGDFPALPKLMRPGDAVAFTLKWTPSQAGSLFESLEVLATDRSPLTIDVLGGAMAAELVSDFGLVAFEAGTKETPELEIDLPANAISFTIEAAGQSRTSPAGGPIFLTSLTGPGGKVYVSPIDPHIGPYIFERNFPIVSLAGGSLRPLVPQDLATFQLPNSDRPDAQLVAGGGTYRFRLSNQGGSLGGLLVRVFIERRAGGLVSEGRIRLNVFLAAGLGPTASGAATDPHIQGILNRADSLLGQVGLGFGAVAYFKLTNPVFDVVDPNDPGPIVRRSSLASEPRVNVFLVKSMLFGAAGVSAAMPGPKVNGTYLSGLVAIGDEIYQPGDLGTVLAHEVCHYLGLGHTREPVGSPVPWAFDIIDDTCPGPACFGDLSLYLMDPNAIPPGIPLITPGQTRVLLRNHLVEAGAPTFLAGAQLQSLSALPRLRGTCWNCR
ncbi:MAG: hypothetical protein ACYSX0_04300 [Planctomycetota bacterium]